ncbi:MAG: flippase [Lachnospiraceae bacterium]|nr:flippase [Lachnospiraceae bacterium]
MTMRAGIKKNTIYNMIKTFSQVIFPLITFPYITRTLLAENVGKINFGSSIVSYFSLMASLGISTYAIRECSKRRENKEELSNIASQLFSINMIMTFCSYTLLGITLLFAKPLQDYRLLISIQSLSIVCTTLGADWLNSAMEDFKYISIRTMIFQIFSLALMFLFVRETGDYYKYAGIVVLSSGGASLVNIFYRRKFCKIRFTTHVHFMAHVKSIVTMFVLLLSQNIFLSSDQTILGLFCGDVEVGLYSTAVKIYNIVNTVIASIAYVVMPKMSNLFAKKEYEEINKLYLYSGQFIIILGLPCIFGLNLLSYEIIYIIGGVEFLGAVPVLRILSVSLILMFITGLIGNIILLPSGNEKYFLYGCVVAAVINIITNIIFIPRFGSIAAACTTLVSHFVVMAISAFFADKNAKIFSFARFLPDALSGCVIMSIAVLLISCIIDNIYIRTFVAVFIGAVIYFIVLFFRKNSLVCDAFYSVYNKIKGRK